jgi:predicted nucleic acid-binding protein
MNLPIFVDTNVPIYAAGRPHALKAPCEQILELIARHPRAFFTDAEVLQELLHRYLALRIWPQGREFLQRFAVLMREQIEPIFAIDVEQAASFADRYPGLSARDLLHLAVMTRVGAARIVSADRGFDNILQVERLDPASLLAWRDHVAI